MATQPTPEILWTVEDYLNTSWSPDREFVDGRIEERHLGEKEHSAIQAYLTFLFTLKGEEWGVEVFPELRTQIGERNFRVPDVCVVRAEDHFERILDHPPLIAIEILSPKDSLRAQEQKAAQYRRFGIVNIWILDPMRRVAYRYGTEGLEEVREPELTVPDTPIRVVVAEIFAWLDRKSRTQAK